MCVKEERIEVIAWSGDIHALALAARLTPGELERLRVQAKKHRSAKAAKTLAVEVQLHNAGPVLSAVKRLIPQRVGEGAE